MQSANTHIHRVSPDALEELIEIARERARFHHRCSGPTKANRMRSVVEFLLRPQFELLKQLTACGAAKFEDVPNDPPKKRSKK